MLPDVFLNLLTVFEKCVKVKVQGKDTKGGKAMTQSQIVGWMFVFAYGALALAHLLERLGG
jgi:hypothetical protein